MSPDTHRLLLPVAVLSDPALPQPPLLRGVNGKMPRRKAALTEDTTHNLLDPVMLGAELPTSHLRPLSPLNHAIS